jgi:hypothetical protein
VVLAEVSEVKLSGRSKIYCCVVQPNVLNIDRNAPPLAVGYFFCFVTKILYFCCMAFSLRKEHKNPDGGLSAKGRAAYNRETGSNLKPPAPHPKNEMDALRRKSFCARSKGQMEKFPNAAKDPNSRLRLARRKWNC